MPEEKTVSGTVAGTTEWKSGKGSWINLQNDGNDYFAYSGKVPEEGETGTWVVAEGSGFAEGKIELVKPATIGPKKVEVAGKRSEAMEIVDKSIESGEKTYFDTQDLIVKQCCVKVAANAVGEIKGRESPADWDKISENITFVAEHLYNWIMGIEESLPEPPEAP